MLLLSAVHASSAALQQPPAKLLALDDDECCGLTGGGEGGGGGGGSGGRDQADCEAESGGHLLGSEASDDAGDDAAALAASASAFASRARGPKASKTSPLARRVRRWTRPLQVFYRQKVFVPMVSYAFLYITVLSMGFLMTSYVQWAGLPLDQISIFRGFGAASGFIATGIFPFLHRRIGLIMTGAPVPRCGKIYLKQWSEIDVHWCRFLCSALMLLCTSLVCTFWVYPGRWGHPVMRAGRLPTPRWRWGSLPAHLAPHWGGAGSGLRPGGPPLRKCASTRTSHLTRSPRSR